MYYQNAKNLANRLLPLMYIFLYLHLCSTMASCSEIYRINKQSTLFYKIINWWYDCPPNENHLLCGKAVNYDNLGNARIEYSQAKLFLKISIHHDHGLADMLSIFKNCDGCLGPSYLRCIWQNEKYLGTGKAASVSDLNQFTFLHIDKIQARILKEIEKELLFVVEGNILGLMSDGKIALHNTGALLKSCPNDTDKNGNIFPITVNIKNTSTGEVIAQYLAIWSK